MRLPWETPVIYRYSDRTARAALRLPRESAGVAAYPRPSCPAPEIRLQFPIPGGPPALQKTTAGAPFEYAPFTIRSVLFRCISKRAHILSPAVFYAFFSFRLPDRR